MNKLAKFLYGLTYAIIFVVALLSILSVFRNVENRFLKFPDFLRIQFFIVSFIGLLLLIITIKKWKWYDYLLPVALCIGLLINGFYLVNYTALVPKGVPTAKDIKKSDTQFSILLANVKMSNNESKPLIDLVKEKKPDLILAMEVDNSWDKELTV